ncbi:MAG: bifunctional (p)ppGpp synthetase/guanosine-3',5'-bis(diphosphate) 3'-pyrophosphohydrolase [Duodenibacillus sp.]|nr:bifunctional (p)ppGpp synthetase/guanosine-3',5'-bis(diphosphate) 3'-pyrophosphohydrolase [Duodenibacillus sp.]
MAGPADVIDREGEDYGEFGDSDLARSLVEPLYQGQVLHTGEPRLEHADGMAEILRSIRDDDELICAAYLFCVDDYVQDADEWIEKTFGPSVLQLVHDLQRLMQVSRRARSGSKEAGANYQSEALRRMLLAMCTDLRVVVLRLASRLQSLRWFARTETPGAQAFGQEALALYCPLANRLGIWQMKWELEDLSLRFTDPAMYHHIVRQLDETREQRLAFMEACVERVKMLLTASGIRADVSGRPKHIYSIYKKMVRKHLRFDQLFDIRAMRVIVDTVERCYEVLSIVHENFTVLEEEFDDYIAHPKPNGYQSLHTVVTDPSGRPVEIQIRTRQMHEFAELGVAAHWRYKETGNSNRNKGAEAEEQRVAWLRQLLAWRSDVEPPERPGLEDDHIYALTPQGRVVELQQGATPVDFAYQVHTQLGHRCRGARVNGAMVPLNTRLTTGQTVEIITTKEGGPSRDWLNPELGYVACSRSRAKVRQWFNAQQLAQQIQQGREKLDRELARLGKTATKLDDLAKRLGFDAVDELCAAFDKEEVSARAVEQALAPEPAEEPEEELTLARQRASRSNVLVVGIDSLLTRLAHCCHPTPPDEIVGFVTRGNGVTIHRIDCTNVRNMTSQAAERMIEVSWGRSQDALYPVDIYIVARNRMGLIKDISEILMRERQNVTSMNSMQVKGDSHMRISVEVRSGSELEKALVQLREVKGVLSARRA